MERTVEIWSDFLFATKHLSLFLKSAILHLSRALSFFHFISSRIELLREILICIYGKKHFKFELAEPAVIDNLLTLRQ